MARGMNSGTVNFHSLRNFECENLVGCENFRRLQKFPIYKISRQKINPHPTATPAKQKTKNCEKTIL